jgi:tRNA(fMet)-specific endonuclease VapC
MFLLDTNIISHMMKNPTGIVAERVRQITQQVAPSSAKAPLCTSTIVQCELQYGLAKNLSTRLHAAYAITMQYIPVLALEPLVAQHYSQLRIALEAQGTPIGPNDTLIAAHALALGCTLVTDNEVEFRRVPGLQVENWLNPTVAAL